MCHCGPVAAGTRWRTAATGLNPTQRVHDINSPLIITGINSEQEEELLHAAAVSPLLPVIVSEHLMENLAVSLARLNLPAFWRLKYRFQSQLNQTQVLFAKYLTHIFVISWERCACEDTRVPKNAVGTDTLSQWRHVVIPSSFLLTAFSPWFMTWRWNRVPQSTSEWTN